ncbi:MAG: hypothetical protein LBO64_10775 [Desulfovibrio sp.]|jgi:outer membrane lipoprotein SlyB|nr:hypothetical protein [Desulfovibrio sp.]
MIKKPVLLLCCLALIGGSTGCASKYGAQTTKVERYPQCYAPIKQLRDDETRVAKTTVGSAVGGALLGALIGGLSTGKVEGAVTGAAVGGIAGGAMGYAAAKQKEIKDQNARMASYLKDLDGDIADLDAVKASAGICIQCYDKEFKALLASYKNGQITKIELDASYQEIKSGIEEARRILGAKLQEADKKDEQYQAAINSELQMAGGRNVGAARTVQAKTVAYQRKKQDLQQTDTECSRMLVSMDQDMAAAAG